MPDYPARTTRSGLKSNGGPGDGAIIALDDAHTPPIALSTALPSGIMLAQLPDSRTVPAPDADRWKQATDKEIENLTRRLQACTANARRVHAPTRLGIPSIASSVMVPSRRTRPYSSLGDTTNAPVSTMAGYSHLSCASNLPARF